MAGNMPLISHHNITERSNLPIMFEEDVGLEGAN